MAKVLRTAIARVTIGDKFTFSTGDGYLQSVEVNMEEQERATSFNLSLYDPSLKILSLFLSEFQRVGGIMVPKGLLSKVETSSDSSDPTQTSVTQTSSTQTSPAQPAKLTGSVGKLQGDDLAAAIVQECKKQGVTQAEQVAYVLATVEVETSMGQILVEFASGQAYEGRSDLGNTQSGDGPRYKGRGPAQTTGRLNYTKWSKILGVDFVGSPELMADLKYGLPVLVIGMRDGVFTGRSLKTYINSSGTDFVNARRIINGLDKASTVAGYARKWLSRLPSLGYSSTTSARNVAATTPVTPASMSKDSSEILAGLNDTSAATAIAEINTGDGIAVKVSLAFNDSKSYQDYEFFLTSIQGSNAPPNSTRIGGKQVRALSEAGDRVVAIHQNISLKELASRIGSKIGAEVIVPDTAQTREIIGAIAQNETDYQLLLRTAKSKGLFVRTEGKKLKLEPLTTSDKRVTVPSTALLAGCDWGDVASDKRSLLIPATETPAIAPASTPDAESSQILSGLNANAQATSKAGILDLTTPADTSKGVDKGFKGNLQLNPLLYPDCLTLKPGSIVELSGTQSSLIRAWRVESVRLSWGDTASCSVGIYLPVAIAGATTDETSTTSQTSATPTTATPSATAKQGAIAPVQPTNIAGKYMLFTPLKTKNSAGAWLYQLQLVEGTAVLDTVQCVSGFIGYKPVPRDRDRSGSGRPCPAGTYDLPSIQEVSSGTLGAGLGSIFINVTGTSPRSAIGIHEDDPSNSATAGCLGTVNKAGILKVKSWWVAGAKKLVIRYGDFEEQ